MRKMIRLLVFLNLLVTICCFTTFPTIHTIKRQSRQIPLNAVSPKFEESVVKSTLGAPSEKPLENFFITDSQIKVFTEVTPIQNQEEEIESLIQSLDRTYGVLLSSSYEYPGRYARWSVGFKAPPLKFIGKDYGFQIIALNDRGRQLLSMIQPRLPKTHSLNTSSIFEINYNYLPHTITGTVVKSSGGSSEGGSYFSEEDRSKQPSIFSIIREICGMFNSPEAGQLGLYGAFGYDLTFQFEPIALKKPRSSDQADIVLFLPDEILVVDNQKKEAWKVSYEFQDERNRASSTIGHARKEIPSPYTPFNEKEGIFAPRDNQPGDYSNWVDRAKQEFKVGNLFEVVLSQIFREKMKEKPSEIFKRLSKRNPSPYGFFMNLGSNEFLIGASPEMFVRVERTAKGLRIETCPISGTIERGNDPLEDAIQIKKLLVNPKEESELTMCTDVDRNDKSRICIPGSVKVLGRRQIEIYSRLIHTVDHVEGILRNGYDALDAFLCHTWAVTVTGAPKTWAIRFIEEMEPTPRIWYGGAVGMIGFDGSLNTGLTLRTIRVKNGIAEVRAGATLLHDSVPIAEEKETELKASAMIDAIIRPASREEEEEVISRRVGTPITLDSVKRHDGKTVLLIDHEDSFVHTLANYLRQTGANVVTCRSGKPFEQFFKNSILTGQTKPDLVVLSPGPGNPQDFQLSKTIQTLIDHKLPIFGVCLGLQGLVEYFGGNLDVLGSPMHGKPSTILRQSNAGLQDVLSDLPESFTVARYHSLYGRRATFPAKDLAVTAVAEDGTIMAIQHHSLPIAAVQFHPESILTLPKYGMKILSNALELLSKSQYN